MWAKKHFSSTLFCGEVGQLQVPQCRPHCDVTRRGGACISFVPIFYLAVYLFIYLFYFPSLSEAEAARELCGHLHDVINAGLNVPRATGRFTTLNRITRSTAASRHTIESQNNSRARRCFSSLRRRTGLVRAEEYHRERVESAALRRERAVVCILEPLGRKSRGARGTRCGGRARRTECRERGGQRGE